MGAFDNLKDKAQDLIGDHNEKIDAGLEKAAEFVDTKTGGKYHDQIAGGVDKAQEALDRAGGASPGTADERESAGVQDLDGLDHDGSMRVAGEGVGAPEVSRESPPTA